MKKLIAAITLLAGVSIPCFARAKLQGYCEQGNKSVSVNGVAGTPKVQASYPSCTVTVYDAGTVNLSSIFSDNAGTVKANPFTADSTGLWFFYADNARYDVRLSGGGIPAPFTIGDLTLTDVTSTLTAPTGSVVGNGTTLSGVVAASPLQYLRRKPNIVATTYEFSGLPQYVASDYNFSAITPTGNMTLGVDSTITISYSPLGVGQANTSHYLYVTDGVGGNETVLIKSAGAGTCTSGLLASCTLVIDGASISANHTAGNYTITSATGGLSEVRQVIASSTSHAGEVRIETPITLYAPVTASVASERITFRGPQKEAVMVTRDTTMTSGNLFANTFGVWTIRDMAIQQNIGVASTGAAIYSTSQIRVENVLIYDGYRGIHLNGASTSNIAHVDYVNTDMTFQAAAGLYITGLSVNTFVSDSTFTGSPTTNANVLGGGVVIDYADGVWMDNVLCMADTGINIGATSPAYVSNVTVIGGGVDGYRTYGLLLSGDGVLNGLRFSGCHFHGQNAVGSHPATGPVVAMGYGAGINMADVVFSGCRISGGANDGMWIGVNSGEGLLVSGCTITDNNRGNNALKSGIWVVDGAAGGIVITGNYIRNEGNGHQKYGIAFGGAATDVIVAGNSLYDNETGAFSVPTSATRVVIGPNHGVVDTVATAASGATLTFPAMDNGQQITVTGNTGVTAVAGLRTGQYGTLLTTDDAVAFTAGATIGNTLTTTRNVPITFSFDGTKIWLTGSVGLGTTPLTTRGDLLTVNSTPALARLAKGTQYQTLQGGATDPTWGAVALAQATAVTGILGSANGGTGNGFAKLSGPTTAEKTFTLPDADATIPARLALYEVTDQATTVASGNLLAAASAGLYQVSVYIHTKIAAGGVCTAAVTLGWTYNGGAKTVDMVASHDLNSDEAASYHTATIKVDAATNITRTITVAGAGCGGAQRWDASIPLVRLN